MDYNWQRPDWPDFRYDTRDLQPRLARLRGTMERVSGMLTAIPPAARQEAELAIMLAEAIDTSAIEGEYLSREDVMSSLKAQLSIPHPQRTTQDARAAGIAELMVDVRANFESPLTEETLFDWHRKVMRGNLRIDAGRWRTSLAPMQIASGGIGNESVHYEAPPASRVPAEMSRFFTWFNRTETTPHEDFVLRSGVAHVYFESIHPFEDGNGRVGRAIAEKVLSQGLNRPVMLSLSSAIEPKRRDYYDALATTRHSNDLTAWLTYYVEAVEAAQDLTRVRTEVVVRKAHFFDRFGQQLNPRQQKVMIKLYDAEPEGFAGGMSARKYGSITKVSKATATRDLQQLVSLGALIPSGEGRGRRYHLSREGNPPNASTL